VKALDREEQTFYLGRVAPTPAPSIFEAARQAKNGRYPPRYGTDFWDQRFNAELAGLLRPGLSILDAGGGGRPTLPVDQRPDGCHYVGLDMSATELEKAPPGSYDRVFAADLAVHLPELDEQFDLVISWFVLEHVADLDLALDNMRRYLKPGGQLLVQLAGGRSPSGLANRALPHFLAVFVLHRLLGEDPERVFPAHYDRCWQSGLAGLLTEGWESVEIIPLYTGAGYARFSKLFTGLFIAFEEWSYRGSHDDLASYYLVKARRAG
jgi:SAM-dependent methyltransferase